MADLISMLSAASGAVTAETDPNFKQTVLLLHGDGTNGAQNNTFLDSSTNNFTITRNGNTTQGTFSPFSVGAGQWSNFFDGSGDYLSTTSTTIGNFGTGDFTVEYWFNPSAYTTTINHLDFRGAAGTGGALRISIFSSQSNKIVVGWDNSDTQLISAAAQPLGSWTHVAVTRSGTTVRLFVNGVLDATKTSAYSMPDAGLLVGTYTGGGAFPSWFHGYISNIRVVKGTAVYTAAFTPPTTPLTAITNTSLLTCQSNRFVDNSTNAFAITRNGDVRVTPFSPFAPTAAYSAGTNGGSGYFDGSGDTLTVPSSSQLEPGSGDFTIEMWLYPLALPGTAQILVQRANSSGYANFSVSYRSTGSIEAYMSLSNTANVPVIINAGSCPVGSWSHIVFTKSNLTYTLYINGTQVGTGTAGSHPPTGLTTVTDFSTSSFPINGYLAGVKIIKGSAVAPSGVPTTPPVNSSGTSLLCNFTNAGIIDNTGKNNLETVGNAQIDTAVKKYGTGSLEFNGPSDYLSIPTTPDLDFGSGNFTVECWVYITQYTSLQYEPIFANAYLFYLGTSGQVLLYNGSTDVLSTGNNQVPLNTWVHLAWVRSSGTVTIYVNGTSQASGTVTASIGSGNPNFIGRHSTIYLNGYIDDLRITKGVARYTANFTAPTKAFPDQ